MIKNKSGVWGELYTARYLRDNGYRIVTSNYSCRFGEIDLIAQKGNLLCFVEVKTRDESTATRPAEAVDENKQNRIILTAQSFLNYTKMNCDMRFDVCEVLLKDEKDPVSINYIENAFMGG